MRGISMPLAVLVTSSMALGSAVAPVVLTLNDCDTADWCKVNAIDMANTKRKNFVIQKLIKIKNKKPVRQEIGSFFCRYWV
jgi:alpha-D-ribose 1-methylphosphonate 5-triphosphate synthase subunit PhnH